MEYNMLNENHNNLQSWKDKLEELKDLPDQGFDKAAAWEKLYGSLNEKEPGKKSGWYWIAAASLAFALIISMFFINNTPEKITASEIKSQSPQLGNSVVKITEKKDERKKSDAIILRKNAIAVVKKANSKTHKIVPVKPFLKLRLTDTVSQQNLVLNPGNDFINPENTSPGLLIAKAGKKKLRIVHFNELGDPVEESTSIERNVSTHYFEIRFANQEVYTNPPVSKQKGITILKINTPVN